MSAPLPEKAVPLLAATTAPPLAKRVKWGAAVLLPEKGVLLVAAAAAVGEPGSIAGEAMEPASLAAWG